MALIHVVNSLVGFFITPLNAAVLIISLTLALISFIWWKERSKVILIYAHLFFLTFPLVYYAVAVPCGMPFIQGLISLCSVVITRLIFFLIPTALILSVAAGYFVIPSFYKRIHKAKEIKSRFVTKYAKRVGLKNVKLRLVDNAKPIAFSLKNLIFVSVGMFEILTRKELEAVLLHELAHIYYKSSFSKFSNFFMKVASPLSRFTSLNETACAEEKKADEFVIETQGTSRFIDRAKDKVKYFLP